MNDPMVVGVFERKGKLNGDICHLTPIEPPSRLKFVLKADPFDQFHRIEQHTVLFAVSV
jgi:hypothetical protein